MFHHSSFDAGNECSLFANELNANQQVAASLSEFRNQSLQYNNNSINNISCASYNHQDQDQNNNNNIITQQSNREMNQANTSSSLSVLDTDTMAIMQLAQVTSASQLDIATDSSLAGDLSAVGAIDGHNQDQQHQHQPQTKSMVKISRLFEKKAARFREIVLQNLGKADRTQDDTFKCYEQTFNKQQIVANRLQKEFKSYVASLKGAHDAGKSLNLCVQHSTAEFQCARHDLVCESLSQMQLLKEDLMDKFKSQVMANFEEFNSDLGEVRHKICKRQRKLLDYDCSRRLYEQMLAQMNKKRIQMQQQQSQPPEDSAGRRGFRASLLAAGGQHNSMSRNLQQAAQSQLLDEARLVKLRDQFTCCKFMFETINNELHHELPLICERKSKLLLATMQQLYAFECQFNANASKLLQTVSDVIDELPQLDSASSTSDDGDSLASGAHKGAHKHNHSHNHNHTKSKSQLAKLEAGQHLLASSGASTSGMGSSQAESSVGDSESPVAGSSSSSSAGSASDDEEQETDRDQEQNDTPPSCEASGNGERPASGCGQPEGGSSSDAVARCDQQEAEQPIVASSGCADDLVTSQPPMPAPEQPEVASASDAAEQERERQQPEREVEQLKTSAVQPGGLLYKVRTNFKYLAEDVDELCFEADEVIQVVEFDESQPQEDGWLMGVREVNGQRGLFPANFTRPI